MTGRGDGLAGAAGGPARHAPVLLEEVVSALAPAAGGTILDGTFGAGGYTRALLDADPGTRVIALDRDPEAIAGGRDLVAAYAPRLRLIPTRFGDLENVARAHAPDGLSGVVLDIGVSSMQLDEAGRGFSFRAEGPLDMRMEQAGPSAADSRQPEARRSTLREHHYAILRRGAALAGSSRAHRRGAPRKEAGSETIDRSSRTSSPASCAAEPHGPLPDDAETFRACAIASTRKASASLTSARCMPP